MDSKTLLLFLEKLFIKSLLLLAFVSTSILAASPPGINRAIEVKNLNSASIMSTPGVVGIGVSLDDDGQAIIKVLTMHVGVDHIPKMLDGIKVKKQVTGMIVAYADPTARFQRPVPIGVSTGHPDVTAGTIGVKLTDGKFFYALSNNHVYANFNKASIGDNVLQPGSIDGGTSNDVIGTLSDFVVINVIDNVADAAIALVDEGDLDCSTPGSIYPDGYGQPSTTIKTVAMGLDVQKYGRTTGHTFGKVGLIDATVDVCYETQGPFRCKSSAQFIHQIGISDGSFSAGGDSGSLIVTDDESKQPVALLFAGNADYTFANPIELVLGAFINTDSLTIDDCSSMQTPSNYPPTANFTYTVNDLVVTLEDNSTDDVSISTWEWFAAGASPEFLTTINKDDVTFTYTSYDDHNVTLTVTDDEGETGTITKLIKLTDPAVIGLTTRGYKVRGQQKAELTWTDTDTFDIYRDGSIVGIPTFGGSYIDNINAKGGGTYVYKICREGTIDICSAESIVTF
ncbi:MAG: PKD domain-containing protein [Psychromonas sp.]